MQDTHLAANFRLSDEGPSVGQRQPAGFRRIRRGSDDRRAACPEGRRAGRFHPDRRPVLQGGGDTAPKRCEGRRGHSI
ncbi:MAG: hypothetical protein MZV70_03065 [Desulfobacterales bacterium]|nr:hypothetical protein [Desulfobacterales bacterium]